MQQVCSTKNIMKHDKHKYKWITQRKKNNVSVTQVTWYQFMYDIKHI